MLTGAPLEDIAEEEQQEEEEDGDLIGDEDEMADFIVDEEDVDENGTIVRYLNHLLNWILFFMIFIFLQDAEHAYL